MSVPRFDLPPISTLLAFEASARLGNLSRAAEERSTSQSAISRHIRSLEKTLGTTLFQRAGRGIALTESGEDYYRAVQSTMEGLRAAGNGLRVVKPGLTVGCTLEISGLVLLPVFSRLKRALGDGFAVRVVVYDYDVLPLLMQAGLDIVFEGSTTGPPHNDAVKAMDEEIVPVASPRLLKRFGDVLAGQPRDWAGVPRLDIGRRSPGWATWETWFEAHDCTAPDAPVETFENYIHLLRAAADGDGIAVGWNGFMSDYVELGRLVALRDAWLSTGFTMYAVSTQAGRKNRATTACLKQLEALIAELCPRRPEAAAETRPAGLETPLARPAPGSSRGVRTPPVPA